MSVDKLVIQQSINDSIQLANYFVMQLIIDGKFMAYEREEKMMYSYNGKYYEPFTEYDFDDFLYQFMVKNDLNKAWKSNRLAEIKRAMQVNQQCPRIQLDNYDNLISCNNGILNLDTGILMPHSKDYYFSYALATDYDPDAPSPTRFIEFLEDCFRNTDASIDQDTVKVLLKIGGYILYSKNPLEKMFLFLGEGSNGKSILMDVYKSFFPEKNVSFLNLHQLSGSGAGFERAKLIGSKLNISTETKKEKVDSEEIKKIVTNEYLTINNKYGKIITYRALCKLIISSNTRPYFNDTSHGIMRRIYSVMFKNRFIPEHEYNNLNEPAKNRIFKAEDRDHLMDKLKKEMPGILNLFLHELMNMRKNGFIIPETENTLSTKKDYQESNDTVGTYLIENYEVDNSDFPDYISATDILRDYREYYEENVNKRGLNYSSQSIGIKINETFRIESKHYYKDGKMHRGYPLKKIFYDNMGERTDLPPVLQEQNNQPNFNS